MLDKKTIRKNQIEILKNDFNNDETKIEINKLYQNFFASELFRDSSSIGITLSSGFELDTAPIIKKAWELKKEIYIPKTYPEERQMNFIKYTGKEELVMSDFGVLEPKGELTILNPPELLLVPGLAFSSEENARVGFGGGYYDRYLQKYPTKTVSLVRLNQYFSHADWKVEKYDILIDKLILPN